MVPDMAVAAAAIKTDGLIIEIHPRPDEAFSDGYQSLDFDMFNETMSRIKSMADNVGMTI